MKRIKLPRTAFSQQRYWFSHFKSFVEQTPQLKLEIENAFVALLGEYDTEIYENRFVVGGVCEYILGAAMRAAGIKAVNTGGRNTRIDLKVPGCAGFSVKGSFTKSRSALRLINSLGEASNRHWTDATIFVLSNLGLGYADPELLPNATSSSGDALVLDRKMLDQMLIKDSEYLISIAIPYKANNPDGTKVASQAVAREILTREGFVLLSSHI
jgi:hypothetical protein